MTVHRSQAERVGKQVLDALDRGRAIAIAQHQARSAANAATIFYLARVDQDAGRPARGRSGRISRKLHGRLSERLVRKYLARLSSGADDSGYARLITIGGAHGL